MFDHGSAKKSAISHSSVLSQGGQSQEIHKEVFSPMAEIGRDQENFEIKEKLFKKGFTWRKQFQTNLTVSLIETNFQSMIVKLQYGNFDLNISVLFTNLEEKIFQSFHSQTGAFGVVRFCRFEDSDYAIKFIKTKIINGEVDLEDIYNEYFLCRMADALEVGPQMPCLFGYDIVVSKSTAFYSMERCLDFIEEPAAVSSGLLQNLRILHSVKFIHCDIKPQNIAYSKQMGKIVFIDFGLSKLIKQARGQKTKTRFSGTLTFCSQEMKNCYILNKPMLVDLYENDYTCLRKSIKQVTQTEEKPYSEREEQRWSQIDFFQQLALLIRLKFFIEREDCQRVLKILETPHKIYKSIYQTFVNFALPKLILENLQIQKRVQELRYKIYDLEQEIFPNDNTLCAFFCQENQEVSAGKIMPISQLLQLQTKSFQAILTKVQIIYKLFLFFDPFSKKNTISLANLNLKETLILKIYQMVHPNQNRPTFFCQKLRSTIIFFYDNLKKMKSLKVMLSLRLLFISIEDWSYVEELEDEIIESIDKLSFKMLKIIEFSLFWDVFLQDFYHRRKQKWKTIVDNMKDQEVYFGVKTQEFFTYFSLVHDCYLIGFNEQKKQVISSLLKSQLDLSSGEEKQTVYTITYLCIEQSKMNYSHFTAAPSGLTLKIYSRFFAHFEVELDKAEQFEYKLLMPLRLQFSLQFSTNPSKKLVQIAINHKFQMFKEPIQSSNAAFVNSFKQGFIYKDFLYVFLQKVRKSTQNTIKYANDYCLFSHFLLLHQFFTLMRFNDQKASVVERLNRSEGLLLLDQTQNILINILSKEGANDILQNSKQVKIQMLIVKAQICFWKKQNEKEIRFLLQSVILELQPLPYRFPNFVVYFLHFFSNFQLNLYLNQDHFSKDMLIHMAQPYIEQKHFYIFERVMGMLGFYIKIKNQRGQSNTHELILMFINFFEAGNQFFADDVHNRTIIYAIEMFRNTLDSDKLLEIYSQIKFSKLEFTEKLYGFFVFQLFFTVQSKLSQVGRHRQITRTALCFGKMPWICQRKIKLYFLRLCRVHNVYSSKRKSFIPYKLEGKVSESVGFKDLKHKMTKKLKESTLQALEKVYKKLKNYNLESQSKMFASAMTHIFE